MAPVPILSAAVRLFQEGWGGNLQSPRPGRLEAVDGNIETVIWAEGGRLHSSCNCPEIQRVTHCRHAVALFAGTMAVLHGRIPGGALPTASSLKRFYRAFAPDPPKPNNAPKVATVPTRCSVANTKLPIASSENRLELVCDNGYSIRWRGVIPRMIWDSLGAIASRRTFSHLPLSSYSIINTLRSLIIAATACQIPVIFRRQNRVSPPIYSARRVGDWRILLNRSPDGLVEIGLGLQIEGKCPVAFIDDLMGEGAILHSGELIETRSSANEFILHQFACHYGARSFQGPMAQSARWEAALSPDDFNARSFALGMSGNPTIWEEVLTFAISKSITVQEYLSDDEFHLVFNIIAKPDNDGHLVELSVDYKDFRVDLSPACHFVVDHFLKNGRNIHFARNVKRTELLFASAALLHNAPDSVSAGRIVAQTLRDESLFPRRLWSEVRQLLADYYRLFVTPETCPRKWLAATPDGLWRFVYLPVTKVARAVVALPEMAPLWASGRFSNDLAVDLKQDVRTTIRRLSPLAEELGAKLNYQGRKVCVRHFDIHLDVRRADDVQKGEIDWFELRPEVACGKLSIPQQEWEQLLIGELFETPEGDFILPDEQSFNILKRVADRYNTRSKPKVNGQEQSNETDSRAHTLEMVEWLELRKLGVQVNMPDDVALILESLANFESLPQTRLPEGFEGHLRHYQKRGYDWLAFLYTHRLGACLADDMGLGKTLQAIAFLQGLKEQFIPAVQDSYLDRPHLVVVPPSLLFNWQNEFKKFSPSLKVTEYTGAHRNLQKAYGADVVLTTYDIMRLDVEKLAATPFHAVVFDEAQLLKNHKSSRAKAARRLRRAFTLCLSGTPVENHAGEYHSILSLVMPGLLGDYKSFLEASRENLTASIARARPVVLRRTKQEILKELPPKSEQDIDLEMTSEQKECYTRMVAEIKEEVAKAYNLKPAQQASIVALTCLMRLRQICISPALIGRKVNEPAPKFLYLIEKLRELRDQGHSALIFSQFTGALDIACNEAAQAGLCHQRLDGSTPTATRKILVGEFQNSEQPLFFFISLRSGGTGLTLTRASYVFHLDPWWNPAVENQASDRAHRIGQTNHVFVQRLIMRGSVEEKMMALKERKRQIFEEIVGGGIGRHSSGMITAEDIKYLLE